MKTRAAAVEATTQQVLRATSDLFWEKLTPQITLADVAERAGVTVQTILRHFGSREKVLAAAEVFARAEIREERQAPAGDISAAVRVIFDHYELRGDRVLRLLAQEFWDEHIREINQGGRETHRAWVEEVFAPQLAAHAGTEQEALVDLLVVATDVYTWKLLRRDCGLDRTVAEERVRNLIASILARVKGE